MEAAMCELTNEQVFSNWQECNRANRQQGADYWHDFMSKRAKRGYKGAQAVVDKMDRLKQPVCPHLIVQGIFLY